MIEKREILAIAQQTSLTPGGHLKLPHPWRVKLPHLTAAGQGMITRFGEPWQGVRRIP